MKFNSQICTTRSQSEALLKLGLKKETADMCHRTNGMGIYFITALNPLDNPNDIPAWSLHRLLSLYNLHYIEFMNDERWEYVNEWVEKTFYTEIGAVIYSIYTEKSLGFRTYVKEI